MKSDIVEAVEPVVDALVSLGVDYRIGGSVASSALGVPRTTLDVDLVCRLRPGDVASFVRALEGTYYVDGEMIRDAIGREASFNVIHLATMIKVDVFIAKSRPWDQVAFARHVHKPLDVEPGARAFELTTAEDIVLHKLEWYRLGGEISERQWKDVLGVLSVQGSSLDLDYLREWASNLGLDALLERALNERQM